MYQNLLQAFQSLATPRVLVVGDLILDRYTTGDAGRISQESPVIVLRAGEHQSRLGGAANVANMLRGLEAKVSIAGAVGDDEAGVEMLDKLRAAGCDAECIVRDVTRPTTVKHRFVGRAASRHPSQILRVDTESTEALPGEIEDELARRITDQIGAHNIVVISDYDKGVCSQRLLRTIIHAAREAGVPVLVDPQRGGDWSKYRGCTLLKPNRIETESAVGQKIQNTRDAIAAGTILCRQLGAMLAVITLDRDGMALVGEDGEGALFPIEARSVYDITGAGDMVIAMLACCLGSNLTPSDAVQLANVAAGLEVERIGVAVIPKEDISRELQARSQPGGQKVSSVDAVAKVAEECRRRGKRVVFTNGCFDLLHVGHVTYLAQAKAMGDVLIVGINSDASVRRLKGPSRPVISQNDRAAMLAAMAAVDHVVVFDEDTPHNLLHAIQPDVLVKGGTYSPEEVVGHEVVTAYGGEVRVAGVVDGISTSKIVASLSETTESPNTVFRKAG